MSTLLEILLSNALAAIPLAVLALGVERCCRRPLVVHAVWMLVLLKLVTPPVVQVPVGFWTHPISELTAPRTAPPTTGPQQSIPVIPPGTAAKLAVPVAAAPSAPLPADIVPIAPPEFAPPNQKSLGDSRLPSATDKNPIDARPRGNPVDLRGHMSKHHTAKASSDVFPGPHLDLHASNALTSASAVDASALGPKGSAVWGASAWPIAAFALWLTGAILCLGVAIARAWRFSSLLARATPADPGIQTSMQLLAAHMNLRNIPTVKFTEGATPPLLWAAFRPPVILLPRRLLARLPADQVQTLLAHELAHFCRRDHWRRWLEMAVVALYWWHPVAWLARRRLRRWEEQCCDAWVLWALPDAVCAYARAIVETVDFLNADPGNLPAFASGLGSVHPLERRVAMILHTRPSRRLSLRARISMLLLAGAVLPFAARGQESPPAASNTPAGAAATGAQSHPSVAPATPTTPDATFPGASGFAGATPAAPPALSAPGSAAPPGTTPAPVGPGGPGTADPFSTPAIGGAPTSVLPVPAPAPTMPAGVDAAGNMEQRLQRLERMIERLLAEREGTNPRYTTSDSPLAQTANDRTLYAGSGYPIRVSARKTLSSLKKERIDIEESISNLTKRLSELDEQIKQLSAPDSHRLDSGREPNQPR